MKILAVSLFLLFKSVNLFSQETQSEFLHLPSKDYILLNNDSIEKFYRLNSLQMINNFIPKDTCFMKIAKIIEKLNEVYIFNNKYEKLSFYEGVHCTNNALLLKNSDFEKVKCLSNTNIYDTLISYITPISKIKLMPNKFTAFLIWNRSVGVKIDDNVIKWEKILLEKYPNNINIIKINLDNNEIYNSSVKENLQSMFSTMIEYSSLRK